MLTLIDSLSIFLDKNNTSIKDFLFSGNKYPNLNQDTNNDGTMDGLNNILENNIIKRACCMRENNKIDQKSLFIDLPDGTRKPITIMGLIEKCKNLSTGTGTGEFEGQSTNFCDTFYTTYCKSLQAINNDLPQNSLKFREFTKYGIDTDDGLTGYECSCINNPMLFNKTQIAGQSTNPQYDNSQNIVFADYRCSAEGSYKTKQIGDYKKLFNSMSMTICSANTIIGNAKSVAQSDNTTIQNCSSNSTAQLNEAINQNNNEQPTTQPPINEQPTTQPPNNEQPTINYVQIIFIFIVFIIFIMMIIYFMKRNNKKN